MQDIWAREALTAAGWQKNVAIQIGDNGRIAAITPNAEPRGTKLGYALPAPTNLHSHAFQRAMAGMTERRGQDARDTFWTWRQLMFRFLDQLTADDVENITAFVQMEMLEAGYAAVAEFHYLHHQVGGTPYDNLAEMSERVTSATALTGIGLTLLPVLYMQGGCDGRALAQGQVRFGNDIDQFAALHAGAARAVSHLSADCGIGVAPHSLRAVSPAGMTAMVQLANGRPLHIHAAEQVAEVEEISAALGQRPIEWLTDTQPVNGNWCLIHCTQMEPHETETLAKTGAVAGLCSITESSLGDGIFDGVRYLEHGGRFGIGSDSNVRISLSEELRTLEYSQRLRDKGRAVLATREHSTGRVLYEGMAKGGSQAAARNSGQLAVGMLADITALDADAVDLCDKSGDAILDAYIFAGDDRMVTDVWAAGRHLVTEGHHAKHHEITERYRATMQGLKERL